MDHVCTWRGEVWFGVKVIFLCAYFIGKIDFTWKHKPALGLTAWLHKDNSVYNTLWVSRSIHPKAMPYTGRATLGHMRRTTLSVFGDPVLRVCATRRHPAPLCETKVITLLIYISVWLSILKYSCLFSFFQTPNCNAGLDIVFNPIAQRNQRMCSTAIQFGVLGRGCLFYERNKDRKKES